MQHAFFPAAHRDLAEAALAAHLVLPALQQIKIEPPARPLLAPVELVQVLPEMIFSGKRALGLWSLGTCLKLVRLHVFVGGVGVAAEDAFGMLAPWLPY